jgi:hypothetical protein
MPRHFTASGLAFLARCGVVIAKDEITKPYLALLL